MARTTKSATKAKTTTKKESATKKATPKKTTRSGNITIHLHLIGQKPISKKIKRGTTFEEFVDAIAGDFNISGKAYEWFLLGKDGSYSLKEGGDMVLASKDIVRVGVKTKNA